MNELTKLMRLHFDRMLDGFRSCVVERRGRGATETEIYALLADAEKDMINNGLDDGLRVLVMERMRLAVRDVYRSWP